MIIIRNRIIPFGRRFGAINICGLMFVKPDMVVNDITVNHESIHTRQMIELAFVGFYIAYMMEWVVRLIAARFDNFEAYRSISFESEAYAHEGESDYLSRRRLWAQWRRGC